MRLVTAFQIAGAAATATLPTVAAAAPVRAASALPAKGDAVGAVPVRAATPAKKPSALIGFPIYIFVAIFTTVALTAVLVSGPSRSPG